MRVCVRACVRARALKIVSMDKILRFTNTLIIIIVNKGSTAVQQQWTHGQCRGQRSLPSSGGHVHLQEPHHNGTWSLLQQWSASCTFSPFSTQLPIFCYTLWNPPPFFSLNFSSSLHQIYLFSQHFAAELLSHTWPFYNTTLSPSVSTISRGMFCGAKYTHHTFTPIIKKPVKLQQQPINIQRKSHS